jgi:hypothetical protein
MSVRDTDTFLEWDVRKTLNALDLGDADAAAAKLALQLARTLDAFYASNNTSGAGITGMAAMATVLLRVLDALGATPEAQSRLRHPSRTSGGAKPDAAPVSWLEQQRQSRATRSTKRA